MTNSIDRDCFIPSKNTATPTMGPGDRGPSPEQALLGMILVSIATEIMVAGCTGG
jgi:hypothetical protein